MGLQVHTDEETWDSARELAEAIIDRLRYHRHARLECRIMFYGTAPHACAVLPRPQRRGVIRAGGAILAFYKGLHSCRQARVVRRTEALKHTGQAGRIWHEPAWVMVIPKSQPWDRGVAACSQ